MMKWTRTNHEISFILPVGERADARERVEGIYRKGRERYRKYMKVQLRRWETN